MHGHHGRERPARSEDLGDGAHRYRVFLGTVTYEYETAPEHGGGVNDETAAGVDETGG